MGKLVQFEIRGAGRGGGKPDPSASAEILIFTGVRYERDAPTAPSKPPAASGAKRKRV